MYGYSRISTRHDGHVCGLRVVMHSAAAASAESADLTSLKTNVCSEVHKSIVKLAITRHTVQKSAPKPAPICDADFSYELYTWTKKLPVQGFAHVNWHHSRKFRIETTNFNSTKR